MLFALLLAADQPPPDGGGSLFGGLFPIILIVFMGYFLLLRPMQRQEKQRQALVANVKKNDKIVNSGGIIGIVESIKEKEDEVVLRGGLRITKSSISRIVSPEETSKDQKDGGG